MKTPGIFSAIKWTMSGLNSQVRKMDVIAENIANAERAPDENGKLYQRKMVVEEEGARVRRPEFLNQLALKLRKADKGHLPAMLESDGPLKARPGDPLKLKVVEVKGEKLVYNPGHPRADENGYVRMPNVNIVEEMVDLISSSRAYEANTTVLNAAKRMAKNALNI
ncbi:flagellar basal body rod protein FlgC [Caldithrix abyssi]|uniref:Flagellar basal-body rod protein FlgC n=1 Tax=Caldithrix abyssi DSM 13497 TaxID=880073 RepID=H1XPC5_CALAY|nr:flagellar basal body rod protein FlgC [Caldithrix abyssi]APF18215.1 flagellar basal-body rod protein FlgC [Caldithrix abyssi DSM 13497]EHO42240.1 flagellar basal-body rod protein FlgC [Caldithrix abyssi DSM 13497]